jgi:predicted HAD superfamily hydrolase
MKSNSTEYSAECLKKLIDTYDVISFDIFDTLIMRKVYYNKDVFQIVGERFPLVSQDFFDARVQSEFLLSRDRYPYMEEIYKLLSKKLEIDEDLSREIMEYEIKVEKEVIIPRTEMIDIFEYCKKSGKELYIVSDMYMRKNILEDIINKLGIFGYKKLFVSCEYNTSKSQMLFKKFKEEVVSESCLHIGDSLVCDIIPAKKEGIDGFRVKTSAEIWEGLGGSVPASLKERTKLAEMIALEYNSPFV